MKEICRKAVSALMTGTMLAAMAARFPEQSASAANTYWKFDFGGNGAASGYTGVSASDSYQPGRGYGFSAGTSVSNVAAAGQGALSDAVQFKNSGADCRYSFCADVPNGLYQVSVWLGNTTRTSVAIEGMLQIINMTGNNAYHTLQVPVSDGQLNICALAGKAGYPYSVSALEIKQISTQTHTNPTIWICGDSTVCNYYPLNSSQQAGWAQMLPQFVDGLKWQIMNQAASGQYARGFVQGGQFDVIEKNGQPGDIYIISIGINDTNSKNNTTEVQYQEIIADMAKRAKAKGMRVILVKQQGRNGDCQRKPLLSGRWYGGALDRVGQALNVEVVDLFNLWQNDCLKKSADAVSKLYMTDGLHPNRAGATRLAELMYQAIQPLTLQQTTPAVTEPAVTEPAAQPAETGTAAPETGITVPASAEPAGEPLPQGDLNDDGVINAADLSLAKRAALTGAAYQYQQAADLNGNLKLDKEDLSLFADYLTGKNVSFADAKYAASEQKYEQGVHEALNTGFTYKDYINLDNNRQSNLTFSVNVRQKGNYLCTFKIANGSANDRSMMISVNGGSEQWKQSFLSTGTWTEF